MIKVKIPECSNPFEVTINGRKYIYEAGIEVEVPDDVAKAIEKHKKAHYKDPPEAKAPFGAISFNNLKDRPFYEIKKDFRTGEIKTDFNESNSAYVPLGINPNDFQLEVDTRIIVKWNGIEYPLITKTHSVTDYDVYWGNGALLMPMLEDTGEPFFFRKTISGSSLGFNIISTQSTATWEIIVPDYYTELKTLDEKYIPNSVKGIVKINTFENKVYVGTEPCEETITTDSTGIKHLYSAGWYTKIKSVLENTATCVFIDVTENKYNYLLCLDFSIEDNPGTIILKSSKGYEITIHKEQSTTNPP